MKITHPLTFTEGHEAPPTDHIAPDLATLETQEMWRIRSVDFHFSLPDSLVVEVHAKAIPLTDKNTKVSLLAEGKPLKAQTLYAPSTLSHHFIYKPQACQINTIRLSYQGSEFHKYISLKEGDIIYEKPFCIQSKGLIHKERSSNNNPPRQLYGYGGIYKIGLPPHEAQQVYFELFEGIHKTEITLTSSSQWFERGINPFVEGIFHGQQILVDPHMTYEQSLSLEGALAKGFAKIKAVDPHTHETMEYASSSVTQNDSSPDILAVTFTKQKGEK